MVQRYFLLIILIFNLVGCRSKGKTYTVGIDPTWFPLDLMKKEVNVFAFSSELLSEISRHEGINFYQINMDWDALSLRLEEKKYDAILSSIHPVAFDLKKYSFSDLYLNTGPVLMVKKNAHFNMTDSMESKAIAVSSKNNEALFIRLYPQVTIRYYNTVPQGLNDLIKEEIDGIVVGYIPATVILRDLYEKEVKIVTPPLNNRGLRLITIYDQHPELIEAFNRGLQKVRDSGKYEKLLKKWGLN